MKAIKQGVAHSHAPGCRPARTPAALQKMMTTNTSQQNNTGPLGGPVILSLPWIHLCICNKTRCHPSCCCCWDVAK